MPHGAEADKIAPLAYGNWGSALALFAYAALFSYAYVGMTAATGALLLFGAVQASMIGWGLAHGERLGLAPDPLATTCGNFVRTVPMAIALSAAALPSLHLDATGLALAVASGAITSCLGYAVWYRALPALQATQAATVQLSVPVIAAVGGVLLLGESFTWQLLVASVAILGGIALVLRKPRAA